MNKGISSNANVNNENQNQLRFITKALKLWPVPQYIDPATARDMVVAIISFLINKDSEDPTHLG